MAMAPARRSWIGKCTSLPKVVTHRILRGLARAQATKADGLSHVHRATVLGMTPQSSVSRRRFLAAAAAAPIALVAAADKKIPIGLELYSVRDEMTKDTLATVRAIAKMGYEVVEFYGPYYAWTPEFVKDVRKLMDD